MPDQNVAVGAVSAPISEPDTVTLSLKVHNARTKQEKSWRERALRSEARNRSANAERDQIVACLARILVGSHLVDVEPSLEHINRYEPSVLHYCCIHLPDKRTLTWLIHDKRLMYFSGIPYAPSDFDGSTMAQKYLALEEVSLSTVIEGLTLQNIISALGS